MKSKRIISFVLAVLTVFSLSSSAFASGETVDESFPLSDEIAEAETFAATGEPLPAPEEPEATAEPETTAEPEPTAEPGPTAEPETTVEHEPTGDPAEDNAELIASQKNGIIRENGKDYFYKDNVKQRNKFVTASNGKVYYCADDGHIVKGGVIEFSGKLYYLDPGDGHVVKGGWITSASGRKYYADTNGVLKTGLRIIGKKTFYFDPYDGHRMKGGWITSDSGKEYYLDSDDGHVVKGGLFTVGSRKYYVDANGVKQKNKTVTVGGKKYYLDADGVASTESNLFRKGVYVIKGADRLFNSSTLTIKKKSGNTVEVDVWWMKQSGTEMRAKISGNKATFSTEEAKGYFIMSGNTITLHVTESYFFTIPEGTFTFTYYGSENTYWAAHNRESLLLWYDGEDILWSRTTGSDMEMRFYSDGTVIWNDGWGSKTSTSTYRVTADRLYIGDDVYNLYVTLDGMSHMSLTSIGNNNRYYLDGEYTPRPI